MATDVTGGAAPAATPALEAPAATPTLPTAALAVGTAHRHRFLFIYGLLAAVLGAAVVGVVAYAGRTISPGPAWSTWKPSGGGLGAAKQIADQVGKAYRLPNGDQLVDVIAKAPSVSPPTGAVVPIHYVAVRGTKSAQDQIITVSSSDSVMYSLCGLGTSCAIATGKGSVQRGTLVRREILELALYTFKYVGGIKKVIAFMPPSPGTQPKYVVYLQRTDLTAQLHVPLAQTLGAKVPLPSTIPAREVHTVDASTESRVYSFNFSQAPQGDAILVLAPLPA